MQDLTTGNCSDIITVTDNALLGTKLRMRPSPSRFAHKAASEWSVVLRKWRAPFASPPPAVAPFDGDTRELTASRQEEVPEGAREREELT